MPKRVRIVPPRRDEENLQPGSTHTSPDSDITPVNDTELALAQKKLDKVLASSPSMFESSTGLLPAQRPRKRVSKWSVKVQNWMVNEGPVAFVFALGLLAQFAIFGYHFWFYSTDENYYRIRNILKLGLTFARGAASVINLCAGIILFFVCRNLISLVRPYFGSFIPLDKNIEYHIALGWSIAGWSMVHVVSHIFNFQRIFKTNPSGYNPVQYAWFTPTGLTGQLLVLGLFLMITSSVESVRRKHFEIFWFTHHIFILWFGLLLAHGSFCFIPTDRPRPQHTCPTFWKYWIGSGVVYLVERIVREIRGRQRTYISKVVQHPSKVVEVQIKKRAIKTSPGQYVFLCCPDIAPYEWHPFTLTSAPEEGFISVHIRVVGDWTAKFSERLGCVWKLKEDQDHRPVVGEDARRLLPRIMVDGPYGTCSEDVFNFEVSFCVGAGIGVTPYASILKSIWYKVRNPTQELRLRKVYFMWVCRERDSFQWFQDLLQAIEDEDLDQFLEIRVYLTGALKESEVKNIMMHDEEGIRDALTGLRHPTHYGRPNLDEIFQNLRSQHPGTDIGVFFCGPAVLSNQLHKACNKWTESTENGARFYYAKENF